MEFTIFVDLRGIEPLISSMPWKRDNRYATGPWTKSDGGLWENRTPVSAMRMRRITTVLTARDSIHFST